MTWFGTLVAVNLQTAFMTPPFGATLFYMKGTAPPGVTMSDVFRAMYPFVALQVRRLDAVHLLPEHQSVAAETGRLPRIATQAIGRPAGVKVLPIPHGRCAPGASHAIVTARAGSLLQPEQAHPDGGIHETRQTCRGGRRCGHFAFAVVGPPPRRTSACASTWRAPFRAPWRSSGRRSSRSPRRSRSSRAARSTCGSSSRARWCRPASISTRSPTARSTRPGPASASSPARTSPSRCSPRCRSGPRSASTSAGCATAAASS